MFHVKHCLGACRLPARIDSCACELPGNAVPLELGCFMAIRFPRRFRARRYDRRALLLRSATPLAFTITGAVFFLLTTVPLLCYNIRTITHWPFVTPILPPFAVGQTVFPALRPDRPRACRTTLSQLRLHATMTRYHNAPIAPCLRITMPPSLNASVSHASL